MKYPVRLIAAFMAVILISVFPLKYLAQSADKIADELADERTKRFTDDIRRKGYLDRQMYEEFIGYLDVTGERYSVDIQDIRPVRGEDVSCDDVNSGKVFFKKLSYGIKRSSVSHVSTDKRHMRKSCLEHVYNNGYRKMPLTLTLSYNENPENEFSADNENILTSLTVSPDSQEIQKYTLPLFTVKANYSDGSHKLLDSSEYIVSDFDAARTGIQYVTVSYTENDITASAVVNVTVTPVQRECLYCHNTYELNDDDTDPGCPYCKNIITGIEVTPDYLEITQGEALPINVVAVYDNGLKENVSGWTSSYNPEKTGLQTVTVEYGGYAQDITVWVKAKLIVCAACGTEYPASYDSCPACAARVVSIKADPEEITFMQYDSILLEVTAYFANGDSKIVEDWKIDRDTSVPGTYTATVSYGDVSTTVKLNVLTASSAECPVCGLVYDISESPAGCPVCAKELVGIEAYFEGGSNLVQLGTEPAIGVILVFRDDHREFASEGYRLEGFNPYKPGIQTVKVIYKDFVTEIVTEVVNALEAVTCPEGHVYYKNADGTDPGCPYCETDDSETGTIIYFDITYTSEILSTIYSKDKYCFRKGNYVSVIVVKKDRSFLYKVQNMFLRTTLPGRKRSFIYGGVIYQL